MKLIHVSNLNYDGVIKSKMAANTMLDMMIDIAHFINTQDEFMM